ncbi:hypothetical protein ACHAO8_008623 [Botrytis cinerea]
MSPTQKDYIYAYRGLYRALLHAVQYAKPARYMGRNMLRDEFRKGNPKTFDQRRISNTITFLNLAAKETGLEHKLVKNLLRATQGKISHADTFEEKQHDTLRQNY